jgi:hypothetical protein
LNAQGTGGGPKIEWPKNPAYPLEASPEALHDACVVWERERGDSLPHRQKKTDRAPSVGRPAVALCGGAISSCRVAQKNRGRGVLFVCGIAREFYGGRGTFSVRLNAEGDTPPVGIKRGDGRSNYYNTNLYYTALYFILLAALAIEKRDKISDIVSRPSGIFLLPHYCASIALALPSFFAPSSSRWHAIQADQLARARLLTHMLVQLASGTLTAPHAHVGTHRHHGQEQICVKRWFGQIWPGVVSAARSLAWGAPRVRVG